MWFFLSLTFVLCFGGFIVKTFWFEILKFITSVYLGTCGLFRVYMIENPKISTSYVEYYKDDKKYKIAIPSVKGVNKRQILRIEQSGLINDRIDGDELLSYLGPYGNFHGISTTPRMMGLDNPVIVTYKNGTQVEYKIDEVIGLTPPITSVC